MMNYQGRLIDGTNLVNGSQGIVFRLCSASAGGTVWYQESQTVAVVDGLYSTLIGLSNRVPGSLANALTNHHLYLEVQIGGTILSPRERIASVANALTAVLKAGDTMTGPISNLQAVTTLTYPVTVTRGGVETGYASLDKAFNDLDDDCEVRIFPGMHTISVHSANGVGESYASNCTPLHILNRHNVSIRGIGMPTLTATTPGEYIMLYGCSNVSISGLRFLGVGPNHAMSNDLCAMVSLMATNSRVTVRDCVFENYANHGVSALWGPKDSRYVIVEGNYFVNGGTASNSILGADGAAVSGVSGHWSVLNNKMERVIRGIEIQTSWNDDMNGIIVANNDVEYANIGIMCLGPTLTNYTDIVVANNTIKGFTDWPGVGSAVGPAIYLFGRRINVAHNNIRNYGSAGIYCGVYGGPASKVMISGNSVYSNINVYGGSGIILQSGTNRTRNNVVQGNIVSEYSGYGIAVEGDEVLVAENIVSKGSPLNGGAICAGWNNGMANDVVIRNNVGYENNALLIIEPSATNTLLEGNSEFSPIGWGALHGPVNDRGVGTLYTAQQLTNGLVSTTTNDFRGGIVLGGVWSNQWPSMDAAAGWKAVPLNAIGTIGGEMHESTESIGAHTMSFLSLPSLSYAKVGGLPSTATNYFVRATMRFGAETNAFNMMFRIMVCDTNGVESGHDRMDVGYTNAQAAAGLQHVETIGYTSTAMTAALGAREFQLYNLAVQSTGALQLLSLEYLTAP